MDAMECLHTRRAIRKYLEVPVEQDKIGEIVRAGAMAPSSGNLQNWKFILVLDADKRKLIAETCLEQWWMMKAPVHIVVISDPEKVRRFYGLRGERLYSIQNCAAAMQNMLLAAHALGLGANWVSAFDEDKLQSLVGLPAPWRVQGVITVGYTDEKPIVPQRYPLETTVYLETFENRIRDMSAVLGETSQYVQKVLKKGGELLRKIRI